MFKITITQYLFILFFLLGSKVNSQNIADANKKTEFKTENIKFKSAGIILAGTVLVPQHPIAAVVLVHGSGQEKRMIKLAAHLATQGIAVLTYDKRGVGESGGVYFGPEVGTNNIDSANLNLLALDASEASNALLKHLASKRISIGLIGFSQAGWVIPLAASKNPKINFMILFSGPIITTLEQLRFQFYTKGNSKFWETHTEDEARAHIQNDPDKYQFVATDPIHTLEKLKIPGLWIFGGKDIQVPVGLSIERLNSLKEIGKNYEHQLFPALGHNTITSNSTETLSLAIKWIKKQLK